MGLKFNPSHLVSFRVCLDPFITPMSAQDSEENGGFAELQFSTTLSPSLASKVTQNLVQL